ncbi:uncharacterized protein E0L32_006895 [Thyridium curvatum]|uniref:chitinase n=1 Tax=Thyridium curvatum TaxID=1093900 RepID=A0A507AXW5_9PEZI|nr:uncharacterized protein E0L32_006895 [Thyridium curvatum]TPX12483.1 hypothetical protein E0L32_006895 [Thyridium curvatum]
MHFPSGATTLLASLALGVSTVSAGFNSGRSDNIAVYWGQNSYGQGSGNLAQQRLSYYCQNTNVNIIPLAFLNVIVNPTTVNFANAGDRCNVFAGTTLLSCPEIEADIKTCQAAGKTILLSIGGATYTEGGFPSSAAAITAANNIWAMFGPVQSGSTAKRPFGTAVVDGFDFDFESVTTNMAPFGQRLRTLMDSAGGKKYYLSAAPQCPYPDQADKDMLDGAVYFDFILVQFYNNYCGIQSFTPGTSSQFNFNFETWDNWAKTVSLNKNVKVLLGIPGNSGAGAGYMSASALAPVIKYCKSFSSFGGVMVWDMSQMWANTGFLDGLVSDLGQNVPVSSRPVTMTTAAPPQSTPKTTGSTPATTASNPSSSLVPQWGQCGGQGYTGPTQCQPPYVCVYGGQWWSSCQAGGAQQPPSTLKTTARPATTSNPTTPTNNPSPGQVAEWGQCGGIGYTGSTQCQSGLVCVKGGDWWSSCQKSTGQSGGGSNPPSSGGGSPSTGTVPQWGQCGGIGYTGSTACKSPYRCVTSSQWWAQCQ